MNPIAPVPGATAAGAGRPAFLPSRRELAWVVLLAVVAALALLPLTRNSYIELLGETLFVAIMLLLAFRLAGGWRQALLPRWLVQLVAIALAALISPLIVQLLTFGGNFSAFVGSRSHVRGYVMVTGGAAILGLLFALGAVVSERAARVRARELQFALERETLERQVADARLKLLTAQVQPHFLLNTLANVQELVETNSPRAAPVFRSLIAYLRAAVPQLQQDDACLGDEEKRVTAYLDLMQMRMPDRLQYTVAIEPALRALPFPPMALLTLVENAIRHGIDPGEAGGRVEVGARTAEDGAVRVWVADSGVGMSEQAGAGTGLANLEQRLRAFFGAAARVELSEPASGGVRAEMHLPAAARRAS